MISSTTRQNPGLSDSDPISPNTKAPRPGFLKRLNSCPRCHEGALFESLAKARFTCTECGLAYDRGSGQHYGAMLAANTIFGIIWLPIFFVMLFAGYSYEASLLVPVLLCVPISPWVIRLGLIFVINLNYYLFGDELE